MNTLGFVSSAGAFLSARKRKLPFVSQHPAASNFCVVTMMAGEKPKNPLAGLGGLGNIMDAMKKAQEFTSVAKDLQEQLKNTEVEASVRGGAVKVIMTAQQVPLKVEVSDELVAKGSTEVSVAVTEGVIAAHAKSTEYMKEKMGNLTKEFGIPQPPQ